MLQIIEKFFERKRNYWFVVCTTENVDHEAIGLSAMRGLKSNRTFKECIQYIDALTDKSNLVCIKTAAWVHPGSRIPVEVRDDVVVYNSDTWRSLTLIETYNTVDFVSSPERLKRLKAFLSNPVV